MIPVHLRDVVPDDLPVFFEHQRDEGATRMAGVPARDRAAFEVHWATKIFGNPAAFTRTIVADGQVAGYIGSWPQAGARYVGYWLGREFWGGGVATRALAAFLPLLAERPLHAVVSAENARSIRVLEKCGFVAERAESGEVAGEEVAEIVFVLE